MVMMIPSIYAPDVAQQSSSERPHRRGISQANVAILCRCFLQSIGTPVGVAPLLPSLGLPFPWSAV